MISTAAAGVNRLTAAAAAAGTCSASTFLLHNFCTYHNNTCNYNRTSSPSSFVDDSLLLFNQMLRMRPLPDVVDFNKLLASLTRTKHYSLVVSMF